MTLPPILPFILASFVGSSTPVPVVPTLNNGPVVAITWPPNGENIGQIIALYGTAGTTATAVNVSIDGTPLCAPATGTVNWSCTLYAKTYPVGPHNIRVTAVDAAGNSTSTNITVNVFHSTPVCAHSQVGNSSIFCETAISITTTGPPAVSAQFPNGHKAGDLIFVGVLECCQITPWTADSIKSSAGLIWQFWGNRGSASLGDGNIVQDAVYFAFAPTTTTTPDTITVTNSTTAPLQINIADAVEYSGVGTIDGPGGSQTSWGGPASLGEANATSGNYPSTPGDLLIAWVGAAPTMPIAGWTERVEDITRPLTMIADQIAASTVANAQFLMNVEGSTVIGLAFHPAGQ